MRDNNHTFFYLFDKGIGFGAFPDETDTIKQIPLNKGERILPRDTDSLASIPSLLPSPPKKKVELKLVPDVRIHPDSLPFSENEIKITAKDTIQKHVLSIQTISENAYSSLFFADDNVRLDKTNAKENTDNLSDILVPAIPVYLNSKEVWPAHKLKPTTGMPQIRDYESHDFFSVYFLLSLLVVAMVRFLYTKQTPLFFKSLLGTRFINQLEKEGNIIFNWAGFLLFGNFLIVGSGLIYTSLGFYGIHSVLMIERPELVILAIAGLLAGYYLIKYLVIRMIGWVFKNNAVVSVYQGNIFVFCQSLGILLIPFLALSIYYPSLISFVISWSIGIIFYLGRFIRAVSIGISQSGFSVYYLILYLCTIEIAPLLVIFKVITLDFNG